MQHPRKRDREPQTAAPPPTVARPAVIPVAMGLRLHLSSTSATGYRGISWEPTTRRHRAQRTHRGAIIMLGWFDTAVEGAVAYARAVGEALEPPEGRLAVAEGLRLHLSRTNSTGYKGVYEDAHGTFQAQLRSSSMGGASCGSHHDAVSGVSSQLQP